MATDLPMDLDRLIDALRRDRPPDGVKALARRVAEFLRSPDESHGDAGLAHRGRVVLALSQALSGSTPDAQAHVYAALVDVVASPEFAGLERQLQLGLAVSTVYFGDLLGDTDRLEQWSRLCIDLAEGDVDLCEVAVLILAEHYAFSGQAVDARALLDMLDDDRSPDLVIAIGAATLRQALGDELPNLDELVHAVEELEDPSAHGCISAVSGLCTIAGKDADALRLLQRAMAGTQNDQFLSDAAIKEICIARIARRYDNKEHARWYTRRALLLVARSHVEAGSPRLRAQRLRADRGVVSSAFSLAVDLDVAVEAVTAAEALASEGLVDVLARGGLRPRSGTAAFMSHVGDTFATAWSGRLPEPDKLFPLGDDGNAVYFVPVHDLRSDLGGYRVTVLGDEASVTRFHLSARSRRLLQAGPTERLAILSSELSALGDDLFAGVTLPPVGTRLVVVPQGRLWSTPWQLLPIGGEPLGCRYQLDIVPSVGLWRELRCPPQVKKAVLLTDRSAPGSAAESRALREAAFEIDEVFSVRQAVEALEGAELLVVSCEAAMRNGGLHLVLGGDLVGPDWLFHGAVPPVVVVAACDAASGTERSEPAALPSVLLGCGAQWVLAPTTKLHGHLVVDLLAAFYVALGQGARPAEALTQVLTDRHLPLHARLAPLLAVGRGG